MNQQKPTDLDAACRELTDLDVDTWAHAFDATSQDLQQSGDDKAAALHRVMVRALVGERNRRRHEVRDLNRALGRSTTWWD